MPSDRAPNGLSVLGTEPATGTSVIALAAHAILARALLAVLGRADAVVLTAGIGEHSAAVRAGALAGLEGLGIVLDPARNAALGDGAREVPADGPPVRVLVVPTDEEREVAAQALALVG